VVLYFVVVVVVVVVVVFPLAPMARIWSRIDPVAFLMKGFWKAVLALCVCMDAVFHSMDLGSFRSTLDPTNLRLRIVESLGRRNMELYVTVDRMAQNAAATRSVATLVMAVVVPRREGAMGHQIEREELFQ
jgi:hypothetical protein